MRQGFKEKITDKIDDLEFSHRLGRFKTFKDLKAYGSN
jgi:hypothetical protein